MDYGENPISPLIMFLLIDGSTNLPIPKVTSPIDCQLAEYNTETMLVGCYYLDAVPKIYRYLFSGEVTKIDIRIHVNWHLLLGDPIGCLPMS